MKMTALALVLAFLVASSQAAATSPVSKVLDLLSDLEAKVTAEGEAAKKTFAELSVWCEDTSKNLDYDIKTGKKEKGELEATIEEESATAVSLSSKLEELAGSLASDEADLKSATEVRATEASDFKSEEAELVETVSTLERAVGILEREMQKGGASMMQLQNAGSLANALGALVQASMLPSADAKKLAALVQASQSDSEDELELGAPAAAVYASHSSSVVDTLEDLLEKAQTQLAELRQKEMSALHNFQLLEQGLKDQIKFGTKDTAEAKKSLSASSEKKATAEGDLAMTTKNIETSTKALAQLKQDCMTKSQDYEAATKSRAEELEALAAAKKAIADATGAASKLSYGLAQVSFLQTSRSQLSSSVDLANFEAVRLVRDLARRQRSPELAQLASRMASAMRAAANAGAGQDPFAKVKGLISDLIEKLESEGSADASHKAYCDKELAESEAKKSELDAGVEKLTTKIDQATARAATLKEEVAALQKSLAQMASSQAEATKMRQEEKTAYVKNKADMEAGLEGVKQGLKILREYYAKDKAHEAADGASSSIVGLLEVVESDFSKGLAEMVSTEETAAATYEKETKEYAIAKATQEADVKYKSKELTGLEKTLSELSSDRSGLHAELDAVVEYLEKLEATCVAKPDTYAERASRRSAEIAGLKEAMQILDGEAALLQRSRATLRGVRLRAHARA